MPKCWPGFLHKSLVLLPDAVPRHGWKSEINSSLHSLVTINELHAMYIAREFSSHYFQCVQNSS